VGCWLCAESLGDVTCLGWLLERDAWIGELARHWEGPGRSTLFSARVRNCMFRPAFAGGSVGWKRPVSPSPCEYFSGRLGASGGESVCLVILVDDVRVCRLLAALVAGFLRPAGWFWLALPTADGASGSWGSPSVR